MPIPAFETIDLLIAKTTALVGPGLDVMEDCDIVIDKGKVIHIGASAHHYRPIRRIDGHTFFATPGLINAHFHPSQHINRGIVKVSGHSEHMDAIHASDRHKLADETLALARVALLEVLKSGTTSIQCVGSDVGAFASSIKESGLRATCVPMLKDITNETKHEHVRAHHKALTECLRTAEAVFSSFHSETMRIHFGAVNVRYASDDLIREMHALAMARNVGFHMHVAESLEYVEAARSRTGSTPIRHLHNLGVLSPAVSVAHAVHARAEEIELLAAAGVSVVHCPRANSYLGVGVCPIREMLDQGVNVALGSDAAINNNSNDVRLEARAARDKIVDHHGITAAPSNRELFNMLTINGAKAMYWSDEIGHIAIGRKADLVLWCRRDLPFVPGNDIVADLLYLDGCRAHTVIVDGVLLLENYEPVRVDEAEVIDRALIATASYRSRFLGDATTLSEGPGATVCTERENA